MESPMQDDITYNQIISFEKNASVKCNHTKRSFIEKGKLILIIENSKKITISGKNIDDSGHRSRIRELVSLATEMLPMYSAAFLANISLSKKPLYGVKGHTIHYQPRGKSMTKVMKPEIFNASFLQSC